MQQKEVKIIFYEVMSAYTFMCASLKKINKQYSIKILETSTQHNILQHIEHQPNLNHLLTNLLKNPHNFTINLKKKHNHHLINNILLKYLITDNIFHHHTLHLNHIFNTLNIKHSKNNIKLLTKTPF